MAKVSLVLSIFGIVAFGLAVGLVIWHKHHPLLGTQKDLFGAFLVLGLLAELSAIATGALTRQRPFGKRGLSIGLWAIWPFAYATLRELLRHTSF